MLGEWYNDTPSNKEVTSSIIPMCKKSYEESFNCNLFLARSDNSLGHHFVQKKIIWINYFGDYGGQVVDRRYVVWGRRKRKPVDVKRWRILGRGLHNIQLNKDNKS